MIGLDRLLGFQEVEGPKISGILAHEGGKVVIPRLPPPSLFRVRGWGDPWTKVSPEGLSQWKNPTGPIGNRTRDLPDSKAAPQPTAPSRTPHKN
jgi:hypothetical protein